MSEELLKSTKNNQISSKGKELKKCLCGNMTSNIYPKGAQCDRCNKIFDDMNKDIEKSMNRTHVIFKKVKTKKGHLTSKEMIEACTALETLRRYGMKQCTEKEEDKYEKKLKDEARRELFDKFKKFLRHYHISINFNNDFNKFKEKECKS